MDSIEQVISVMDLPDPPDGLRIAHITEAPLGGVLGCIHELIEQQAVSHEVEAIYTLAPEINSATLAANAPPCLEIRSYRHRRGSVAAIVRLALSTIQLMRDRRPNVVHVHSTIAGVVVRCVLLCQFRRPRIVYSPHCWAFLSRHRNRPVSMIAQFIERVLAHITDCIVCVSEYEKSAAVAAGISAEKCVVIHNGILETVEEVRPPSTVPEKPPGKLHVLFVGRFDTQKGFDVYLEAMRRLGDMAIGTAVGDFVVHKGVILAVPTNVRIVGWCSRAQLHSFYREADVLIMPSVVESSPLVALEAMRAALPVIASRAGGIPEVVVDFETGRLFKQGDVHALVEIVREITIEQLQLYGQNSLSRFQRLFTARRMASALMKYYRAPDYEAAVVGALRAAD